MTTRSPVARRGEKLPRSPAATMPPIVAAARPLREGMTLRSSHITLILRDSFSVYVQTAKAQSGRTSPAARSAASRGSPQRSSPRRRVATRPSSPRTGGKMAGGVREKAAGLRGGNSGGGYCLGRKRPGSWAIRDSSVMRETPYRRPRPVPSVSQPFARGAEALHNPRTVEFDCLGRIHRRDIGRDIGRYTCKYRSPYVAVSMYWKDFLQCVYGWIRGNQSSRSRSPGRIPWPGNGGEVGPGRST